MKNEMIIQELRSEEQELLSTIIMANARLDKIRKVVAILEDGGEDISVSLPKSTPVMRVVKRPKTHQNASTDKKIPMKKRIVKTLRILKSATREEIGNYLLLEHDIQPEPAERMKFMKGISVVASNLHKEHVLDVKDEKSGRSHVYTLHRATKAEKSAVDVN